LACWLPTSALCLCASAPYSSVLSDRRSRLRRCLIINVIYGIAIITTVIAHLVPTFHYLAITPLYTGARSVHVRILPYPVS
jgi:hypothetical protein